MTFVSKKTLGVSLVLFAASGAGSFACGSDASAPGADGGTPPPGVDGAVPVPGVDGSSSPEKDAAPVVVDATVVRPPPVFFPANEYEDLVTLDAAFPFGVVARYDVDGDVLGARWGNHDGPMLTTSVYTAPDASAPAPGVVRYTLPATARGAAAKKEIAFTKAPGLPTTFFYGVDGMVDMPFGNRALLTYTGSGAAFPGEALLYTKDYDAVVSRAKSNGIYSAIGIGAKTIVYTALSAFSATASATTDNGLFVSETCNLELVAGTGCKPPAQLFGWTGSSGPVAVDPQGNAFVGASLAAGDAVYAASAGQVTAVGPASRVEISTVASGGTSSIAAIGPEGSGAGWVVAKGYDGATPAVAYAQAYLTGGALAKQGTGIGRAIAPGPKNDGFSVFASPKNDLWIAVELTAGTPKRAFLQLRRKP